MAESFLDRLITPDRTTIIGETPSLLGRDASAYARAALAGEVDNLIAVPIGSGRNHQLNISAMKMGQLVAVGAIDEHTVTETLGAADGGLHHKGTRDTIASGLAAGIKQGRHVPEPTRPAREFAPWEQSDDPLAENYAPPVGSQGTATVNLASRPSTQPSVDGAGLGSDGGPSPDERYAAAVALEAARVRLQRDARRSIDHEDAVKAFRIPPYLPTLTAELALPDSPVTYRVDRLIPTGANVVLTAQYKTGKTTLINSLAKSLVDGEPFLGRYDVDTPAGRVALFNYEVSANQYRTWLRDVGVANTDRIAVLNLRGYRLPLTVPHIEDWVVKWLLSVEASVWIVDPMARAAVGHDEDSNTEMGVWLDTLDVIKRRANIGELVMPNHTGRGEAMQGQERGRGATRVDDWADVRWLYTKDADDVRYFRATGRDVETDESALAFDPKTRLLTLTGGDRASNKADRNMNVVLTTVRDRPGIGVTDLRAVVKRTAKIRTETASEIVDRALATGLIHQRREGHTVGHFSGKSQHAPEDAPNMPPD